MTDKKVWTRSEIVQLLAEYEQHRELWDTKCYNYRNKSYKHVTLLTLAEDFDTTHYEISRKLHNLKTQFAQEIKKERDTENSSERYVSKWKYLDNLKFMLCQNTSAKTATTDDSTGSYTDLGSHFIPEDDEPLTSDIRTPPPLKRTKKSASHNRNLTRTSKKTCKTDDEYQIFGDYVANEIRNMHFLKYKGELKRKIQRLIIEFTEIDDNEYLKCVEEPVSSNEPELNPVTSRIEHEGESSQIYNFNVDRGTREKADPSRGGMKAEENEEKELLLSEY